MGNVLHYYDSVNGTWNMASGYDTLNRLTAAQVTDGADQGWQLNWTYDPFGNRTHENFGGTSTGQNPTPIPASSALTYTASNKIQSAVLGYPPAYDAAGNITCDGYDKDFDRCYGNQYLYDAEGRICAVQTSIDTKIGYLYNADGVRVAKGTISSMSCNPGTFTTTATYILSPDNQQMTEVAWNSGTPSPAHTNVWAGGQLTATLSAPPQNPSGTAVLNYHLTDWLGTRRVLTDALGNPTENCHSMPFGNGFDCISNPPTEHLFTGKERDTESGNDYFGARYFASSMGRFLSPDPGPYIWNDPQTLNRYAYSRNNPLKFIDPNGQYFVIASGNEHARQAISMLLRSNTGRALVGSIAADPRPTYVKEGRIVSDKGLATPGINQSIFANANGLGVLGGTTITIDWVNAHLGANGNPLFWMILKAYAHELSHTADKNAAPNWGAADDAGKAGDRLPNGDPCPGGVTTCGSAEDLAKQILLELGNPGSYTPDAGADAEAGAIIDQGNREENGDPPFSLNPNSSLGRQRPPGSFCSAEFSVCDN
jgi:RHS repeat-associated protein